MPRGGSKGSNASSGSARSGSSRGSRRGSSSKRSEDIGKPKKIDASSSKGTIKTSDHDDVMQSMLGGTKRAAEESFPVVGSASDARRLSSAGAADSGSASGMDLGRSDVEDPGSDTPEPRIEGLGWSDSESPKAGGAGGPPSKDTSDGAVDELMATQTYRVPPAATLSSPEQPVEAVASKEPTQPAPVRVLKTTSSSSASSVVKVGVLGAKKAGPSPPAALYHEGSAEGSLVQPSTFSSKDQSAQSASAGASSKRTDDTGGEQPIENFGKAAPPALYRDPSSADSTAAVVAEIMDFDGKSPPPPPPPSGDHQAKKDQYKVPSRRDVKPPPPVPPPPPKPGSKVRERRQLPVSSEPPSDHPTDHEEVMQSMLYYPSTSSRQAVGGIPADRLPGGAASTKNQHLRGDDQLGSSQQGADRSSISISDALEAEIEYRVQAQLQARRDQGSSSGPRGGGAGTTAEGPTSSSTMGAGSTSTSAAGRGRGAGKTAAEEKALKEKFERRLAKQRARQAKVSVIQGNVPVQLTATNRPPAKAGRSDAQRKVKRVGAVILPNSPLQTKDIAPVVGNNLIDEDENVIDTTNSARSVSPQQLPAPAGAAAPPAARPTPPPDIRLAAILPSYSQDRQIVGWRAATQKIEDQLLSLSESDWKDPKNRAILADRWDHTRDVLVEYLGRVAREAASSRTQDTTLEYTRTVTIPKIVNTYEKAFQGVLSFPALRLQLEQLNRFCDRYWLPTDPEVQHTIRHISRRGPVELWRDSLLIQPAVEDLADEIKDHLNNADPANASRRRTLALSKPMSRGLEKVCLGSSLTGVRGKPSSAVEFPVLSDVARSSLILATIEDFTRVLGWLQREPSVQIARVKNRFENPTLLKWRDVVVNLFFTEKEDVLWELQLVHDQWNRVDCRQGPDFEEARFFMEALMGERM